MNRAYVRSLDFFVLEIFALANYRLTISYEHFIYFQTFNMVIFVALILAEQRISIHSKVTWILVGATILAAGHFLFRIGNVLLSAFAWQPAFQMTAMLTICGEYLLPILLWLTASGRWRQAPRGFE